MPTVKNEVILKCTPEVAFDEISKLDFMSKSNPRSGIKPILLFQNERIIRYTLNVENVGSWESERVLIPERNMIITQRRSPLTPFKYMVVLHIFEVIPEGTLFTYIEEFELDEDNKVNEDKILSDISNKVIPNMEKISEYFTCR